MRELVAGLVDGVAAAIASGQEMSLPGLGKFPVKNTAARSGSNQPTGEPIEIAAAKKVSFTPAKALKGKL